MSEDLRMDYEILGSLVRMPRGKRRLTVLSDEKKINICLLFHFGFLELLQKTGLFVLVRVLELLQKKTGLFVLVRILELL